MKLLAMLERGQKRQQPARIVRNWRAMSLKRKIWWTIFLLILSITLYSAVIYFITSLYTNTMYGAMSDSYTVNNMLTALTAEEKSFAEYVLYLEDDARQQYLTARGDAEKIAASLAFDPVEQQEQYVLLHAIHATYLSYQDVMDEALAIRGSGGDYVPAYDRSQLISGYLDSYIQQLERLTISLGNEVYQRHQALFTRLPIGMIFTLGTIILCISLWRVWFMKSVIRPILRLTDTARTMADNQYDGPDLSVENEDEIAHLVTAVNTARHSTAQLVDSLNRQRELSEELHREELNHIQMDAQMNSLRISLLQAQINPHFLFNTLNIISRMATREGAQQTEELILHLANLFRYNLQSVENIVPLSSELKIINDYIVIQRIRFGDRMRFTVDCQVDQEGLYIPAFTMQPLIENAVIHGISSMENGGEIAVRIYEKDKRVHICVSDTGVGIEPEQLKQLLEEETPAKRHMTGIGLKNVRARIALIYPGSSFDVVSQPGHGTSVEIVINRQAMLAPPAQDVQNSLFTKA